MRDKDLSAIAVLWAPAFLIPFGLLLAGRSLFWGDLTYLHHPWRALASQMIQQGRLPLWDPYAYLGMPLAAEMQCATWYPGTLPFYLFSFAGGLALFHALHFGLAGFFAYLWLRSEGLTRAACFAGAAAFMGCGSLVSRAPFLNHLSTLAFLPAFFLLRRRAALLAFAFALAFLSGYPLMMAGSSVVAFVLPWSMGGSVRLAKAWAAAAALSAGLGACLLLPALELTAHSHRGAGLGLQDTLLFGLTPSDWRQWISPVVVSSGEFSASIYWWKTCYLGFFAWAAILLSIPRLSRRAKIAAAVATLVIGCLLLGGSNPISVWLWARLPPLRYVRYPGNLAYLLLPLVALLVACGVHRRPWASGFALALGAELLVYAVFSQPTMPSRFYTDAGPLVRELQETSQHRYLLSPNALHWHRGADILDWRHRLYGLTNLPFRLSAVGNFGEPLVPAANYDFLDFMFSLGSLDATAPFLSWSDIRWVMTRDRLASKKLRYDGERIWQMHKAPVREASRAAWFSVVDGDKIPSERGEVDALPKAIPVFLPVESLREDRRAIRAKTSEGWLYLAEPAYPGWEAKLDGRDVVGNRALGVFQKFRVPAGTWEVRLRYAPVSWAAGLALSLVFLMGAAGYWYNRLAS